MIDAPVTGSVSESVPVYGRSAGPNFNWIFDLFNSRQRGLLFPGVFTPMAI